MKLLFCATLLLIAGIMSGCTMDVPGMTAQERFTEYGREMVWEQELFNDDVDRIFMLRPAGEMAYWDVVHRD